MRIAVASDDGRTICGHLGRCASFVVFETEDGKITSKELRNNNFTSHATGKCDHNDKPGEGAHSHGDVIGALGDCQVVISQGMGRRIAEDLEKANIKPIITTELDAEEAIRDYLDGKLAHFPENACGCGGRD
jgi:predicted Fe-Mo cluster-binding NifX family protein